MRNLEFKWKDVDVVPREKDTIAIMFKDKGSRLPFEIGAGYYYNNRWFINGYSPAKTGIENHREFRVLAWSYYSFRPKLKIEDGVIKQREEKLK